MPDQDRLPALTVHQPMAFAIVSGAKKIENRWSDFGYRGPLAIHAGAEVKQRWMEYDSIKALVADYKRTHGGIEPEFAKRSIVGICRLVGAHRSTGDCCKPWGMADSWHLELADAVELRRPISQRGQQGLWTVSAETAQFLLEQLPDATFQ